jgi:alkanesulfonate monooxygenase SsuD/methylene tetrahydromethanopterin reductase-like flavin-dependent oxidoreductase (luciferase family)
MTDYGHKLLFGSAMAPANERPDETVALAVLAEAAGLDLATFQDHPYQPRFLDTWTLLSYVAARTSRIGLSANVTNLPLRPPAVLARSVASLDLLTGGRVELGLGAGGFWDAIEAMGGRRLAPKDAVRALDEAIEIIRQTWDADVRGGVRVDGEFYRVAGAKRGPAPAHPVRIWLGAYKPQMLRLTGRRADGWLPSLGYIQPGDLPAGNAVIDEAALEAGRAPGDVRRLLNIGGQFAATGQGFLHGPAKQWAEELAELALEHGVSAFLLGGNDPDAIQRFGAEVAPAVRELVEAARATPAPAPVTPSVRPAAGTRFTVVPTHDDGHRYSRERPWDESTRPTGPPRDEDRTYTAREQANGQHLIDVHDHLRAELAEIRDLVDQVAAGALDVGGARSAISTMTMRQNNWTLGTYCESYCRVLTMHHTLEDRSMFPQLRRADRRLGPVIDQLEYEHGVIHEILEGVDRALVALVSKPDGMADLRAAVDLLTDALRSHLAYEERELVEPLSRIVS